MHAGAPFLCAIGPETALAANSSTSTARTIAWHFGAIMLDSSAVRDGWVQVSPKFK